MTRLALIVSIFFTFCSAFGQNKLRSEKAQWLPFEWANPEDKDAILLRTKLDTIPYTFNWQLDTGSPYTFVYGATVKMFAIEYPVLLNKIKRSDTINSVPYLKILSPAFVINNKEFLPKTILINYKAGGNFPQEYIKKYKGAAFDIGTIGLDIFKNRVLILDFKRNKIGIAGSLSKKFYNQKLNTTNFKFYKNRIILPIKIGEETYPFFYDCGASMFSLQTTYEKSKSFAPAVLKDTLYNINNGESGTIHNVAGGTIEKPVRISGKAYENVKVFVEPKPSEIFDEAKVLGLLGNKLFLNNIIIIDFKNNKFTVLD